MLLDVSQPVTPRTSHFPGDVPFSCGWTGTLAEGSSVNVGWMKSSPHVGTHVDAPYHYREDGHRVGGFDLDVFVGRCVVIDAVGRHELDASLFRGVDLRAAPRVLFRTQRRTDPETFLKDFPVLTSEAIDLLAGSGVRLVGVDVPSFDKADAKRLDVHLRLGAAGIANVENLMLDAVTPGQYELLAAPLRWEEMDAAPMRALLRR